MPDRPHSDPGEQMRAHLHAPHPRGRPRPDTDTPHLRAAGTDSVQQPRPLSPRLRSAGPLAGRWRGRGAGPPRAAGSGAAANTDLRTAPLIRNTMASGSGAAPARRGQRRQER